MSRTVNTVQTAAVYYCTALVNGPVCGTLLNARSNFDRYSRYYQRSSPSMIDVSSLVLPATADDAPVLEKTVSLKPVVGTVVQGGVIFTPPK